MDEIYYLYPDRIHLIWLVVVLLTGLVFLELRGRQVLSRFVSMLMQNRLAQTPSKTQRVMRLIFITATLILGMLALMRPQTKHTETRGVSKSSADIIVLLDVSKSMYAADIAPNRLDRARAELRAMLPQLKKHRVGLIAFAGRPAVLSPLTGDRNFFELVLNTAGPDSVGLGGTRIGDALRKAMESFPAERQGSRLVILLTDGDDHDSYPVEAAEDARREGVVVLVIGFGEPKGDVDGVGGEIEIVDPESGARVVMRDRDGNVVRSYLGAEMLKGIADRTNGQFLRPDANFDLSTFVQPYVEETEEEIKSEVIEERYEGFLFSALLCLFCSALASMRVSRRGRDEEDSV